MQPEGIEREEAQKLDKKWGMGESNPYYSGTPTLKPLFMTLKHTPLVFSVGWSYIPPHSSVLLTQE